MDRIRRMSIIDEEQGRRVRMGYLAVVGSHAVNGVANLHTDLMRQTVVCCKRTFYVREYQMAYCSIDRLLVLNNFVFILQFRDFSSVWPEKFQNKTNGVTPRRWLLKCNRALSDVYFLFWLHEMVQVNLGIVLIENIEFQYLGDFTIPSKY